MNRTENKRQVITVCAFIHKNGKVLIAKRAVTKKFLPGKYELLGGHVEFGETLEVALQRETQEEVQVEIIVGEPLYAFTYVRESESKHAVEIVFFATLVNQNAKVILNPEDHCAYRWISEDEVDTYLPSNDQETIAIKKGFQLLEKYKDNR